MARTCHRQPIMIKPEMGKTSSRFWGKAIDVFNKQPGPQEEDRHQVRLIPKYTPQVGPLTKRSME